MWNRIKCKKTLQAIHIAETGFWIKSALIISAVVICYGSSITQSIVSDLSNQDY